jgi:tetratricopeptide (TPR) repeat protein
VTACPDDNRLVEYVEGLLAPDLQRATDAHVDQCERCRKQLAWFAQGTSAGGTSGATAAEPEAGSSIADRYTITELVGSGGMSVVYAAYDRVLDRKVALKLLRDADPGRAVRLANEAQAMARLAHPNVLPVYDVGTAAGRMFLTAELVHGGTLAQWMAAPHTWREVVAMFVQAARGLAAAHTAGIAHRDFKPSNVLLGDDGRVRVADFGLAAASGDRGFVRSVVDTESTESADPSSTKTGDVVGTPAYMAPEQLVGEVAGAESDQFAFCVSLFEALHGERPFKASSLSGLATAIARGPNRGARRVPARVQRIVDRGLDPDATKRWPDMTVVTAELERALDRPRIAWIAAAIALVVVAGGVALAVAHRPDPCSSAKHEQLAAWTEARAAIHRAFAATDPAAAEPMFARVSTGLDAYATAWTAMRGETCEATEVHHTQSAVLLDLRMQCLARHRAEVAGLVAAWRTPDREQLARAAGAVAQLTPLAECADIAALTARVPPPADPIVRTVVARAAERLATSTGLARAGKYSAALAIAAAVAHDASYPPLLAEALYRRGQLEGAVGDNRTAERTLTAAVEQAARAHDDRMVANAWIGLVEIVGHRLARSAEGLALARAAEIAVLRAGDVPEQAADLHQQRGTILRDQAKFDDALAEQKRALELRTKAFPPNDPRIAQSIHDVAEVERVSGKVELALADHQRALAMRIAALGPDHPLVAVSLTNLGHCYFTLGKLAEARTRYEQALAIDTRGLPAGHIEIGNALVSLAGVELAEAKWTDAIVKLERARTIYVAALGPNHPLLAIVENNLGEAERGLVHYAAAIPHYEAALAVRLATGSREQPGVATALSNLADVLVLEHRDADAAPKYEEALATFRKLFGNDAEITANPLVGLAQIALDRGDWNAAISLLERALALRAHATPDEQAEVRDALARARAHTR